MKQVKFVLIASPGYSLFWHSLGPLALAIAGPTDNAGNKEIAGYVSKFFKMRSRARIVRVCV